MLMVLAEVKKLILSKLSQQTYFQRNIPSKSSLSRCNRACNSCNSAATEAPLYKRIEPPYTPTGEQSMNE
jgi:hypothetical protein